MGGQILFTKFSFLYQLELSDANMFSITSILKQVHHQDGPNYINQSSRFPNNRCCLSSECQQKIEIFSEKLMVILGMRMFPNTVRKFNFPVQPLSEIEITHQFKAFGLLSGLIQGRTFFKFVTKNGPFSNSPTL